MYIVKSKNNVSGLCKCGCGNKTSIITHSNKNKGLVIGGYFDFIHGHNVRGTIKSISQKNIISNKMKEWYQKNPEKVKLKSLIKPWNTGITKDTDIRVKENGRAISLVEKGVLKPKLSIVRRELFRLGELKTPIGMLGKKHTDDFKIKRSIFFKNLWSMKDSPFNENRNKLISEKLLGCKKSEETKHKIKLARRNQVFPIKDTKIEIKIQNYLKQLDIEFYTHQYRTEIKHGYQSDIFIPIQKGISQNIIIECDGDYWHGNPLKFPVPNEWQIKQIEKDKIRTEELKEQGFRVIRIWENDINNMSLDIFKNKF